MVKKRKDKFPKWRVENAIITQTSNGTFAVHLRPRPRSKPLRKRFKSLEQAIAFVKNGVVPVPYDDADARLAAALLPEGITLAGCVQFYLSHAEGVVRAVQFSAALDEYLFSKKNEIATKTLQGYNTSLKRFLNEAGDIPINTIGASVVEDILASRTAYSRNAELRALSAFFSWCKRKGYCTRNCCEHIAKTRIHKAAPVALSLDDAVTILSECSKVAPRLVPYFTLGMFAGLRPQETLRLKASAIGSEYITIDTSVAKTGDARTIPIRDNLKAWLNKYPLVDKALNATALKRLKGKLSVAIPHDALRHSFATYAYELCKDATLVASEMGHQGTSIFFRHYRALAAPGSGEKWFSILPF